MTAVAKVGLIVLDACRNDPFGGRQRCSDGRGAASLRQRLTRRSSRGSAASGGRKTSCSPSPRRPARRPPTAPTGNSPFTAALAKYLSTDGLEIRSVLTLVQQEVYDLSRGKQLPYVESGLPQLFFAATSKEQLPERERLLLAMADVTPDMRVEVERIASDADMPLAPLYGALITADGKAMAPGQRQQKLQEAADAFIKVRAEMRNFASSDPEVTELRQEAEAQLSLGAFDEARALLAKAADIDGKSREDLKSRFIERTLFGSNDALSRRRRLAARNLRYELAIRRLPEGRSTLRRGRGLRHTRRRRATSKPCPGS